MAGEDCEAVLAIAAAVPTAPHWPPSEYVRMLAVIGAQPDRRGAWIAMLDGTVCGFAMASQAAGTAELEAVVTSPQYRRQGAGSGLLQAVIAWSRRSGAKRLQLEARLSNLEALRLYERLQFARDGMRARYYRNPEEDAVLMSLHL